MINVGLSDMSVNGGSDNFRRGSSSRYQPMHHESSSAMNRGFGFNSQTSTNSLQGVGSTSHGYGYQPMHHGSSSDMNRGFGFNSQTSTNSLQDVGSTSHGYGSGYDSQPSSSHQLGNVGHQQTRGPQQPECTREVFEQFLADYQAWHSNTIS